LCLSGLQRQKRQSDLKACRHEAHPKAHKAPAQPPNPRPPRPQPIQKLETIPRPRILVRRTEMTLKGFDLSVAKESIEMMLHSGCSNDLRPLTIQKKTKHP